MVKTDKAPLVSKIVGTGRSVPLTAITYLSQDGGRAHAQPGEPIALSPDEAEGFLARGAVKPELEEIPA